VIDLCTRLLFWTLVYVAAARIGAWISRSELRGLAHLAWDGLAGLPPVIAAWLALGLVRFDRTTVGAGVAALLVVAALRAWRDPVARFHGTSFRGSRSARSAIALLAGIVLLGLSWDRVPVLFYDSLAYHFAQPETWLLEGRIAPYDWSLHSWFPPGMSVLYGVGLAIGAEPWAADANVMLGAAMALVLFDFARRCWGATAGLIAVCAWLGVPQILFALGIPGADLAHGAFAAAALGALWLARADEPSWSRRAAWLTGGALLTKYLGILVPLLVGLIFSGLNHERGTAARRRLRAAVLFGLPGLLLLAPWLIANTVAVGNPLAPIAAAWIPVDGLAAGGDAAFTRDARGGLPGTGDLAALVPRLFGGADDGLYPSPAWGWPFAVWAAVALAGAFRDRLVGRALAVAGLLFVVWLATYRWERFLVAVTFFVCLALAGTLWRWCNSGRTGTLLAVLVLLPGLAYVPRSAAAAARFTGGVDVFLGREAPHEFVLRSWPQQRLLDHEAVAWNPATDRLLLVGEMRHFRVPVPRAAPSGFNVHPLVQELHRSLVADQVHAALRRRGFTHLLIDFDWVERSGRAYPSLRPFIEDPARFRSYVESLGPPIVADGRRALYAIPEQR
jgi:hypothetical protein